MVAEGDDKVIDGWLLYGVSLNAGRPLFERGGQGDKDFGAWKLNEVWSSNLDNQPHCADEQAAMWAAKDPTWFTNFRRHHPKVRTVRGLHAKWKEAQKPQPKVAKSCRSVGVISQSLSVKPTIRRQQADEYTIFINISKSRVSFRSLKKVFLRELKYGNSTSTFGFEKFMFHS